MKIVGNNVEDKRLFLEQRIFFLRQISYQKAALCLILIRNLKTNNNFLQTNKERARYRHLFEFQQYELYFIY